MTDWNAFVGVTAVVVALFLALARLSQGLLDDESGSPDPDTVVNGGVAADIRMPPDAQSRVERDGSTAPEDVPASGPDRTAGVDTAFGSRESTAPDDGHSRRPNGSAGRPAADLSPGALLANVALTQGIFGALVAAAAVYFAVPPSALGLDGASLSTGAPAIVLGTGLGVALWLGNEAAAGVADAAGVAYDERLREMLAPDTPRGWLLLLGGTLPLIAVVEELLFRAAFVGAPSVAYSVSPWLLVALSSVAFALGHGAQGKTGMVVTGALGLVLAATFVLTESLVVVVVAHYLVNALEFLVHEGLGFERPFGWLGG